MQEPVGVTPYLLTMLLCDSVIVDAATKKKSLIGLFEQISYQQLPAQHPVTVYIRFTDAAGTYTFRLDYVHVPTNRTLAQFTTQPIPVTDRLLEYSWTVQVPALIDQPGLYEFRLFADDAYIGRVKFTAQEIPQPGGG